jgi:hypothetical protein
LWISGETGGNVLTMFSRMVYNATVKHCIFEKRTVAGGKEK